MSPYFIKMLHNFARKFKLHADAVEEETQFRSLFPSQGTTECSSAYSTIVNKVLQRQISLSKIQLKLYNYISNYIN